MTCVRETLTEHLHISDIQLSETEKKNIVGIFINWANTLSLEENSKLLSAVQKFISNSARFAHDANNYTYISWINTLIKSMHPRIILPKARYYPFPEVNINIHLLCLLWTSENKLKFIYTVYKKTGKANSVAAQRWSTLSTVPRRELVTVVVCVLACGVKHRCEQCFTCGWHFMIYSNNPLRGNLSWNSSF